MWLPESIETVICPPEDLLRDILCILFVPHFLEGVGVDHLLIFVNQHPEGIPIA
jgi:hypothetical protein